MKEIFFLNGLPRAGNGLHTLETGAISDYKEKYNAYSIIPKSIIEKYKQCNF